MRCCLVRRGALRDSLAHRRAHAILNLCIDMTLVRGTGTGTGAAARARG